MAKAKRARTPEVVGPEKGDAIPIQRQCKECGCYFTGEPRGREDGSYELGPCPAKAGRNKKCGTVHVYVPEDGLTFTQAEIDFEQKREELHRDLTLSPYLEGREYDRKTFVDEARFYLTQSVLGAIEAGKRLVAIREAEGHGDFCKILEEDLGIPTRTAYRMMKLAERTKFLPTLAKMKRLSAAYEISELSEEDLKEMEETGLLDGTPVDELDRMTVRELRDLCRKLKKQSAKGEEQLKEAKRLLKKKEWAGSGGEVTEMELRTERLVRHMIELTRFRQNLPEEGFEVAHGCYNRICDVFSDLARSFTIHMMDDEEDLEG